ncbi:hypothetical protein VP01_378g3, partial [Puccinia sorghi]
MRRRNTIVKFSDIIFAPSSATHIHLSLFFVPRFCSVLLFFPGIVGIVSCVSLNVWCVCSCILPCFVVVSRRIVSFSKCLLRCVSSHLAFSLCLILTARIFPDLGVSRNYTILFYLLVELNVDQNNEYIILVMCPVWPPQIVIIFFLSCVISQIVFKNPICNITIRGGKPHITPCVFGATPSYPLITSCCFFPAHQCCHPADKKKHSSSHTRAILPKMHITYIPYRDKTHENHIKAMFLVIALWGVYSWMKIFKTPYNNSRLTGNKYTNFLLGGNQRVTRLGFISPQYLVIPLYSLFPFLFSLHTHLVVSLSYTSHRYKIISFSCLPRRSHLSPHLLIRCVTGVSQSSLSSFWNQPNLIIRSCRKCHSSVLSSPTRNPTISPATLLVPPLPPALFLHSTTILTSFSPPPSVPSQQHTILLLVPGISLQSPKCNPPHHNPNALPALRPTNPAVSPTHSPQ